MKIILLALVALALADEGEWSEDTAVVFPSNWDSLREKHERVLVMFYAPWCGHCKDLKPKFEAAASQAELTLTFAAVDCTTEEGRSICGDFEVKGYPTLKFFSEDTGDDGEDYQGGRTQKALEEFAKQRGKPFEVDENTDLSKLKTKVLRAILRTRGVKCRGCSERSEFIDRVKETHGVKPKVMTAAEKAEKKRLFLEKYGGRTVAEERRYKAARAEADKGWEENGAVVHLIDDDFETFRAANTPMLAMFYAPWCGHCKTFKPEFAAASETMADHPVKLVAVNCVSNPGTCQKFNVNSYPTTLYFADDDSPVPFEGARTAAGVAEYLEEQLGISADDKEEL